MKRHLSIISFIALIAGLPAFAEGPEPFPDFTFKRVAVPKSGSDRRITVQIDVENGKAIAKPSEAEALDGSESQLPFEWYWEKVSPRLVSQSASRLELAVNSLSLGPGGATIPSPRLQDIQNIAAAHGIDILRATIGTNVSPALVLALIGIESSGKTNAVSSAGATGLMQLMPATAERFGVQDATSPKENIKGGVAYLDWLMTEFENDPVFVLAAYNAGENAVKKHEGVPPFSETRAYVPKVLAAWRVAKGLCVTPPELISDGCVFVTNGNN